MDKASTRLLNGQESSLYRISTDARVILLEEIARQAQKVLVYDSHLRSVRTPRVVAR